MRVSDQTLREIVQAIVQAIHPEQILLFGSLARDAKAPGSDLDLLIVEREPFGPGRSRWQELRQIRRVLSRFRVPKDILVYSRDEVAKWRRARNHVIATALGEGKVLYERS